MEEWRSIIESNGTYEVSSLGQVRSCKTSQILKHQINPVNGYCNILLRINGKYKGFSIHRLVAIHFIDNPLCKKEVNHIDGNKQNNCLNNLEWVTKSENKIHAIKNGFWIHTDKHKKAMVNFNKRTKSKPVVQYDLNNNVIAEYESTEQAAKAIGASQGNIVNCCNGKKYYKTVKGFIFKYK